MKYETYQSSRRNYKGLEAAPAPAPIVNLSLEALKHKSSMRFASLQPAPKPGIANAAKLQTVQLAGGGSITIQNQSGTDREKAINAKAKLKELGLKRSPIIDIKDAKADFKDLDLEDVTLTGNGGADFTNAKMKNATIYKMGGGFNATKADMRNITINESRLDGSTLTGANLSNAHFVGENSAVNLKARHTNLSGVDFGGAHLTHSDFGGAKLDNTTFRGSQVAGMNLDGAKGSINTFGEIARPEAPKPSYYQRAMKLHADYMHGPSMA